MDKNSLKELLQGDNCNFVMEAHSPLSGRIAEISGFKAVWASSLSISTLFGARDCSEISWSQSLDVVGSMADILNVPILFDGDSGHGNFNNFRQLVRKLERRGVQGIVVEDKRFPKTNSFIGNSHSLSSVEEFCGKIRAGLDIRGSESFLIIARSEALIAGEGVQVALDRANSYCEAGADAIFMHSRSKDASEIFEFLEGWKSRAPVVVAPTTFYQVSPLSLEKMGVRLFICANHSIRASVSSMSHVCNQILQNNGLVEAEKIVAPLSDIFQMLNYDELAIAEELYLSK